MELRSNMGPSIKTSMEHDGKNAGNGPLCLLAMDSSALNHHSSGDSGRTQPFTAETRTLMAGNFHQLPAKELGISRTQGVGCMNLAFYEVA